MVRRVGDTRASSQLAVRTSDDTSGGTLEDAAVAGADPVPRRVRRAQARHAAILDAALPLFSRFGLHGTTVDQIAEAADISKTNLFYYFASKEEVYVAVLRRLLDAWLAPLRAIEIDTDPEEAIKDYIRDKVEFSRSQPEASRLFCLEMVQGAPLLGQQIRTSLKQLVDDKAAIIRHWMNAGLLNDVDPYHFIFAVWSTTQHYADFAAQAEAIVGCTLDDDAYRENVIRNIQLILLRGVARCATARDDRSLSRRMKANKLRQSGIVEKVDLRTS